MTSITLTNGSRTPLRYPGGKGKVTRYVAHLLDLNGVDGTYIEPFRRRSRESPLNHPARRHYRILRDGAVTDRVHLRQ